MKSAVMMSVLLVGCGGATGSSLAARDSGGLDETSSIDTAVPNDTAVPIDTAVPVETAVPVDTAVPGDVPPVAPAIPMGKAALIPWLNARKYADFAPESGIHASTGPHGAGVRSYVNSALAASFAAGNAVHPVGAAAVKELSDGANTLVGWAVEVKVAADSAGGKGWYWFESYTLDGSGKVYADGTGASVCTGCHAGGKDYVLTPWPLK